MKVQNRVAWACKGVVAPMRTVFALGLAVSVAAFGVGLQQVRGYRSPCRLAPTPTRYRPARRTAAKHPRETLPSPQRTNNARVFLSSC